MKIVVCVKYVPDASGDREFEADNTVDRGADGLLSELDEYAVEQALQISDEHDDVEIIALTMGPDDASDAIKKALQMGVDSGVHVCDEAIEGSDSLATSAILAAAIRKLSPDLVMCGMASTDGSMGVLPAMLSERLGWASLTLAHDVTVSGDRVTIHRDGETATQTVEASMPMVLSVTDQSGEARYPGLKNIMAAKKKPVTEWDLSDLDAEFDHVGLQAAATQVSETAERPPKQAGQVVTDADGAGASAVVDFLVAGKYL